MYKNILLEQDLLNNKIRNILIIKLREIGDIVLTTPTIRAIKEKYPESRISIVVPKTSSGVLHNNPYVDRIIPFDKTKITDYLSLIRGLRARRYDLVINLHASHRSALISFLSGAKYRIVFNNNGWNYYSNILIHVTRSAHESIVKKDLAACSVLGICEEGNGTEIFPDSFDCGVVEPGNDLLVAVALGAREEIRCWELNKYMQLCGNLAREYGAKILLIVGPSEENKIIDAGNNLIIVKGLTLLQLAALLGKVKLFIGNISGPMHIAAAMGTPTVTICAPKYIEEWHPYDIVRHKIVSRRLNCSECEKSSCVEGECLNTISVDDVMKVIEQWGILEKS